MRIIRGFLSRIFSFLAGFNSSRLNNEKHYFIDSGYITLGKNYTKNCEKARFLNRLDGLKDIPKELLYAHTLLLGVVGGILEENSGKQISEKNEAIRRQFVLIASFIQGISFCEQSILQALYLQASNLLRQEFEILCLLKEIYENKRKDGRSANAKHAPYNGNRLYGPLSALAHLADHNLVEAIIGYNNTWGDYAATVPQYQKDQTTKLYGIHVGLVLSLVDNLVLFYAEICGYKMDEREKEILKNIIGILTKHQILTIPIMVSDLNKSSKFYEDLLKIAGYKRIINNLDSDIIFTLDEGKNNFGDVVLKKGSGGLAKFGHLAIEVSDTKTVKKFYDAALVAGGRDGGAPNQYPEYGTDYYGAFILDPDGNKVGVVTHSSK